MGASLGWTVTWRLDAHPISCFRDRSLSRGSGMLMTRIPHRALLVIVVVALGCEEGVPSDWSRFEDQCTRFCENGLDCVGDPEGRRANCRSSCSGGTPISRTCEEAAVVWGTCLADRNRPA